MNFKDILWHYGIEEKIGREAVEALNLNRLTTVIKSCNFNDSQKSELAEILSQSENAREKLDQIIEVGILDCYDFKNLKDVLDHSQDVKKKPKFTF